MKKTPEPAAAPEARGWRLTQKKLALIHIVKTELGLSDAVYHRILKKVAGVDSAKELDEAGFRALMRYLVASKYYKVNASGMTLKQKLYVNLLARELGWETEHVRNFIHKYYHRDGFKDLTRKEASNLIESLKAIVKRSKRKRPAAGV